jgi:DNA-directed RNA polymerase subunit RPC12/RpoP
VIVYEHTLGFDRDGCIVGARFVTYRQLETRFVCANCGGNIIHHIKRENDQTIDWAECGECGCRDFISQRYYDRQCREYYEILENLPPDMRALFPQREPLRMTADEAIADLFGL